MLENLITALLKSGANAAGIETIAKDFDLKSYLLLWAKCQNGKPVVMIFQKNILSKGSVSLRHMTYKGQISCMGIAWSAMKSDCACCPY